MTDNEEMAWCPIEQMYSIQSKGHNREKEKLKDRAEKTKMVSESRSTRWRVNEVWRDAGKQNNYS